MPASDNDLGGEGEWGKNKQTNKNTNEILVKETQLEKQS